MNIEKSGIINEKNEKAVPRPNVYSTRTWGEVLDVQLPPLDYFFGEAFALGRLGAIFGQGGIGKSRISMNLCRNQVLGLPFAGFETGRRPLRHLLMGSENDLHRLQGDARKMTHGLTPEQCDLLRANIRMATLENSNDPFISLSDPTNIGRWQETIKSFVPDVLWVDPWGDVLAGDPNSDSDCRETIRKLTGLLRGVNPSAALVILHHARTGRKNIDQATGIDAANFGKNSKVLYSSARGVLNLAPADDSEVPPILCYLAKINNGKPVPLFCLRLDPETMLYHLDDGFDLAVWQGTLNQRASNKQARSPEIDRERVRALITESGPLASGQFHDRITDRLGVSERAAREIIQDALDAGVIAKSERLKQRAGKVLYGLPEAIAGLGNPSSPGVAVGT